MLYRLVADVVVVVHLAFIAFVAVGSVLVWWWPRLLWPHVAVLPWAAAVVTVGLTCPLTPLEQQLRDRADRSSYDGGFIDHYLSDVVYPGRFTALARLVVAAVIVVGYACVLARQPTPPACRGDHRSVSEGWCRVGRRTRRSNTTAGALSPASFGPGRSTAIAGRLCSCRIAVITGHASTPAGRRTS